jgi:hypothetical protein
MEGTSSHALMNEDLSDFIPITGRSRVGRFGRLILCPHCHETARVYHFAWAGLQCGGCKAMVNKTDYLMHRLTKA